jgi:hypothetical protein
VASPVSATLQDFVTSPALTTSQLDSVASPVLATLQDFVNSHASITSQLDFVASPFSATLQLDFVTSLRLKKSFTTPYCYANDFGLVAY